MPKILEYRQPRCSEYHRITIEKNNAALLNQLGEIERDNRSTAVTQVFADRGGMRQTISAGVTTTCVYNALAVRRHQGQVFDSYY